MTGTLRRKYVPDLPGMHAECETNYVRLRKILPGFAEGASYNLQLGGSVRDEDPTIRFRVLFSARYTAEIEILQLTPISDCCAAPHMLVRVYHDTRMAEVVRYQGMSQFRGKYVYPNKRMRQPDEKSAVNRLLADWLKLCLELGCATAGLSAPSAL